MDPKTNEGTGAATAASPTLLRVAVKEDNPEVIALGTWTQPPAGYRIVRDHEIKDVLNTLPAPMLREKIFEACTGNQNY
jgi:hypothetical protein